MRISWEELEKLYMEKAKEADTLFHMLNHICLEYQKTNSIPANSMIEVQKFVDKIKDDNIKNHYDSKRIGEKVGAIRSREADKVYFYGFGTYLGFQYPDRIASEEHGLTWRDLGISNPAIKLDSGDIVYGFECWWGSEEQVKKILKEAKEVIHVDIKDP